MKKLLFVISFFLISCGRDGQTGATGADGITILSNQKISAYLTDMCTNLAGEVCSFLGGQQVKYSDGTTTLTGMFSYSFGVAGDTDINEHTAVVIIPSDQETAYATLSQFVDRGGGYYRLFLAYTRSPESVKLVHDSNNNGVWDVATDTDITTVNLIPW